MLAADVWVPLVACDVFSCTYMAVLFLIVDSCRCACVLAHVWCERCCPAVRLSLPSADLANVNVVSSDVITLSRGANNPPTVTFQYSVNDGAAFYDLSSPAYSLDGATGGLMSASCTRWRLRSAPARRFPWMPQWFRLALHLNVCFLLYVVWAGLQVACGLRTPCP